MNQPSRAAAGTLVALVILALGVRVWQWPARYQVGYDEAGYLGSSLVLVEGITPGYKPAPAGVQIWLGWAWAQAHVACEFLFPDPSLPKPALQVRPFVAMDRALFAIYRDMSGMREFMLVVNVALLLAAVWGAFDYGMGYGGVAGGLIAAGLLATAPLFVEYSLYSRPYSMAWSFGVLAMCAARRKRVTWAAVLMGLAIGSRIDMLVLLPLVWWEVWCVRRATVLTVVALFSAYAVAPWLLTGLAGNLRAIATIQFANPMAEGNSASSALVDFAFNNGLGVAALVFLIGAVFMLAGANRIRNLVLIAIVVVLCATVLKSTGYGLRHHGAAVLPLVLASSAAAGAIGRRWPRMSFFLVAASLALPLVQTARAKPAGDVVSVADWLQDHVPPGSTIYIDSGLLKVPLPTPAAADRIWSEVTDQNAWRKKFFSGLERFGVASDQLPRAMSEENLVQDRGSFRRWFILGSNLTNAGPRYDIRLIHPSPIFGVQIGDISAEFAKTGGVVLWRPEDYGPPPSSLGVHVATIPNADGESLLVFARGVPVAWP